MVKTRVRCLMLVLAFLAAGTGIAQQSKKVDTKALEKLIDVKGYGGTRQEAMPLVWNGTMYLITARSVVFGVSLHTGEEIWRWDPKLDMANTHTCCGVVNRGLALYDGKIYVGANDGRLVALDAMSGKEVWSVQTTPREDAGRGGVNNNGAGDTGGQVRSQQQRLDYSASRS